MSSCIISSSGVVFYETRALTIDGFPLHAALLSHDYRQFQFLCGQLRSKPIDLNKRCKAIPAQNFATFDPILNGSSTPLEFCLATEVNSVALNILLKQPGVDVNTVSPWNMTPLMHLAAIPQNSAKRSEAQFLASGCDFRYFTAEDQKSYVELLAVFYQQHFSRKLSTQQDQLKKFITLMLHPETDINARNRFSSTVFHIAATMDRGDLLDAMAVYQVYRGDLELEIENANGLTPLQLALVLKNYKAALALLQLGADPLAAFALPRMPLVHLLSDKNPATLEIRKKILEILLKVASTEHFLRKFDPPQHLRYFLESDEFYSDKVEAIILHSPSMKKVETDRRTLTINPFSSIRESLSEEEQLLQLDCESEIFWKQAAIDHNKIDRTEFFQSIWIMLAHDSVSPELFQMVTENPHFPVIFKDTYGNDLLTRISRKATKIQLKKIKILLQNPRLKFGEILARGLAHLCVQLNNLDLINDAPEAVKVIFKTNIEGHNRLLLTPLQQALLWGHYQAAAALIDFGANPKALLSLPICIIRLLLDENKESLEIRTEILEKVLKKAEKDDFYREETRPIFGERPQLTHDQVISPILTKKIAEYLTHVEVGKNKIKAKPFKGSEALFKFIQVLFKKAVREVVPPSLETSIEEVLTSDALDPILFEKIISHPDYPINEENPENNTLLERLVQKLTPTAQEKLKILLKDPRLYIDDLSEDKDGMTPLLLAAQVGNVAFLEGVEKNRLLEKIDFEHFNFFNERVTNLVISNHHFEFLLKLRRLVPDLNFRQFNFLNITHHLAYAVRDYPQRALEKFKAFWPKYIEIVGKDKLTAEINAQDLNGNNAILNFVDQLNDYKPRYIEILQLFLEAGGDIMANNEFGENILHMVVMDNNIDLLRDILKLIPKENLQKMIDQKDNDEVKPIEKALPESKAIIQTLLDKAVG